MNILIAPDSFKDSLGAPAVARALASGILKALPHASIQVIPMADGGEGTVESVIDATGGEILQAQVMDPLMRKISSFYGVTGDGSTAVIEMAAASGLELLTEDERDPWITTTFGTGQLINRALDQGCRKILLGIGGSATNDGGTGMARALGVKFLDEKGEELAQGGGTLGDIREIRMEGIDPRINGAEIRVACDVTNPLTGPDGASRIYGPQKGADQEMVLKLDQNLEHLAQLIGKKLGKQITTVPGSGAAGGLGAGLMAFLGARLVKGFDMVAESVQLEKAVKEADLVITGEGKMDRQTLFGKTPLGVAQLANKYGKPVIGVAGTLEDDTGALYEHGFQAIMPILEKPADLAFAIANASILLERTGQRIARMISLGI